MYLSNYLSQGTASLGVRSGGFFLSLLNAEDGSD